MCECVGVDHAHFRASPTTELGRKCSTVSHMAPSAGDLPTLPRYGERSLAEVLPSALAALGVAGYRNALDLPQARGVCVLLIDGLGHQLLAQHRAWAPYLAALADARAPLTAGFPSTTATSIASLATGGPPGEHGIVGYTFRAGVGGPLMNALTWREQARARPADLRDVVVPEDLQPRPTMLERAADAGISTTVAAPPIQADSGLTRAVLRGGRFTPARSAGDLAHRIVTALNAPEPALCYAYFGDLDLTGHARGPGSFAWLVQLRLVDEMVRMTAEQLPPQTSLVVVADHGMIELPTDNKIDYDRSPALQQGVAMLGGEVRARHVYAEPGAAADVLAAWREVLGERAWVRTRDEAINEGWFGPSVQPRVAERIGDVVAAMRGSYGVIRSVVEPVESRLIGHHGSLTPAEQLVPLIVCGAASVR